MAKKEWMVQIPIERVRISFPTRKAALKYAYDRSKDLKGFTQYVMSIEGYDKENYGVVTRSGDTTEIFVDSKMARYVLKSDGTLGRCLSKR